MDMVSLMYGPQERTWQTKANRMGVDPDLSSAEQMSPTSPVAIGIWLKSGSRDEGSEFNGISHFIEHMVFKGTETRSAELLPAKSTPSAATWMPSPQKNASASTSKS